MNVFDKGDFVRVDGVNAVVVATDDDFGIPEGYIAVFFGTDPQKRESKGESENLPPKVFIMPMDLVEDGLEADYVKIG